ncbi:hypothetical protein [Paraburkholderia susongensis]|uniref:hypothetical protein n=1 Tax=Paraburkholderia susongensis TaxID=1515439 RepID=UPI001FC92602|nr:hypothetical protein [Paraburkholderia susongensis]
MEVLISGARVAACRERSPDIEATRRARRDAAVAANAEDASVWRWFSALLEERRIRWRFALHSWVVHVDRMQVATEPTFYEAIRAAKEEADELGVGML